MKRKDKLLSNRHIIEFFPSLVSSLGVLGTFYGITVGLLAFDSSNLDQSIPDLLDGLKTAFFTSLAGMTGSMILSAFINRKQDEKSGGISDINQAAIDICQAVKEMSSLNSQTMRAFQDQLKESEADRKAFYRSMGDIMEQVKKSQMIISESINKINTTQLTVASAVDSIVLSNRSQDVTLSAIKESNKTIQKNTLEVSDNTRHLGEILDVLSGMGGGQEEMISQVSKIKDIIHDEVLQIEEDMEKTSKLLERKFDEFTDLLKKSNTEALVEVMTRVTEEFQKQMNSLINRLIQENFDQLNNSVEKLNQWQQENKEMIVSLTRQYKEMSNNFATGSSELTPRFKEILDEFLPRYFNILLKDSLRINIQEIRIEGHTDDVPIPRYDSDPYVANAKLSQERALSVLKYFRTMPTFSSYSNIQKQLLEYWLTANGLSYGKALDMDGDFVIVTGKDIDRAHSRRVEFRIVTSGDDILENFVKQNSNK